MASLKEIKKEVYAYFASQGKTSQNLVKSLVKQLTNGADLRKKSTWDYALGLLKANSIEPMKSVEKVVKSIPVVKQESVKQTIEKEIEAVNVNAQLRLVSDRNGVKSYIFGR